MTAPVPPAGEDRTLIETKASETAAPPVSGPYRSYVLALLFAIAVVNMVDKSIIAALAEPLKAEFDLSDTQFGFLAGLVYAVSYTVCGIPIGMAIDRINRAKLLACLVAVWGTATMAMGAVGSFPALILARMGVAGAESGGASTSVAILSDYFPPEKRATAIGILYSAMGVAAFLAFGIAGAIAATYGWRVAIVCAGAPGLVLGVLAFFTLKEPQRGAFDPLGEMSSGVPRRANLRDVGKTIVLNPTLRYLGLASMLNVVGVAGLGAFTASFFYRVHHLPLAQAGWVTGLVMGGAYAGGSLLGGWISDRVSKRSAGGGCYFVAIVTFLATPIAVAGFLLPNLLASIALIFAFKVLVGGFYGATFAGYTRASPVRMRGAVTTYMALMMNLVGFGAGPQLTGVFSDLFAAADVIDPLKWSLVTVSLVLPVSAAFYLLAGRHMNRADPGDLR